MRYLEFKNAFREFPVISSSHISNVTRRPQILRNQLNRWQKKGLVIKLRKGLYVLNENDRKIHPSRIFLANAVYFPSYVSTEYALGYYDLIPERVEDVTSVTAKKTAQFSNHFGTFVFQHVKRDLFFGSAKVKDENGLPVLIAQPEKALLDFIYLNLSSLKGKGTDVFGLSYRLQNLDILKKRKLKEFAKKYENKWIDEVLKDLFAFMKQRS